jgi:hypothetical protein
MRGDTELFDECDREGTRIWRAEEGEALCLDGRRRNRDFVLEERALVLQRRANKQGSCSRTVKMLVMVKWTRGVSERKATLMRGNSDGINY